MVAETTHARTVVRKIATRWHVVCPCGFMWNTRHYRLALLFATEHHHARDLAVEELPDWVWTLVIGVGTEAHNRHVAALRKVA